MVLLPEQNLNLNFFNDFAEESYQACVAAHPSDVIKCAERGVKWTSFFSLPLFCRRLWSSWQIKRMLISFPFRHSSTFTPLLLCPLHSLSGCNQDGLDMLLKRALRHTKAINKSLTRSKGMKVLLVQQLVTWKLMHRLTLPCGSQIQWPGTWESKQKPRLAWLKIISFRLWDSFMQMKSFNAELKGLSFSVETNRVTLAVWRRKLDDNLGQWIVNSVIRNVRWFLKWQVDRENIQLRINTIKFSRHKRLLF